MFSGAALDHVAVGIVFQDSLLFNTTIRENIRIGKPVASDGEIESVARAAELHDVVMAMPEGYDTSVGERGARLSGGLGQRIAIARALLRDPGVLVLDEATSALDAATEASINQALERAGRGRTVVSVTHRLVAIVNMDHIFVMDAGRLVEHGRHGELLALGGVYAMRDYGRSKVVSVYRKTAAPAWRHQGCRPFPC